LNPAKKRKKKKQKMACLSQKSAQFSTLDKKVKKLGQKVLTFGGAGGILLLQLALRSFEC
jgi:hypothetical protein